jgi:hypothetical protein
MKKRRNRTIALYTIAPALALGVAAVAAPAQGLSTPPTYDAREEQASWINDPHLHDFYRATVEAFANGPDRVDPAAYEKRSREIFTALAVSRKMPPERLLNHLARIPGEMIAIVKRDPQTLASYDSFITQLFGPQKRTASEVAAPR